LTIDAPILQLFPEHREVPLADAYSSLGLQEKASPGRPYVVANMVTTADGRAALGGRTKALSSDTDRELFHRLREEVDAVMVGVATIALENYGPLVRDAKRRERRRAAGLEPVPLAVTASRSLELPVQAPLFADADSPVVVLTDSDRSPPASPAMSVERSESLSHGMALLRKSYGIRAVLLEGGPTLLAAMVEQRLVDELFLSVAPVLAGVAGEPSILEGPVGEPLGLRLMSALHDEGHLFLRYRLPSGGTVGAPPVE
jgi:riboflavin biosynthesis pyrimidine reductase